MKKKKRSKKKAQATFKQSAPPPPKRPAPWLLVFTGIAVGSFITFLGFLYTQKDQHKETVAPPVSQVKVPATPPAAEKQPSAQSEETKKPDSPDFDFYNMLPSLEVVIDEAQFQEFLKRPSSQQDEKTYLYILQAGSFRQFNQADQLKAQLAFLGIETQIQSVVINDDEQWYRVRLLPETSLRKVDQKKRILTRNGIRAILLKVEG